MSFTPTVMGASTATLKLDTQIFTLTELPMPRLPCRTTSSKGRRRRRPDVSAGRFALAFPGLSAGAVGNPDNELLFGSGRQRPVRAVRHRRAHGDVHHTGQLDPRGFPNNASQIKVQTGSVAGSITLTPSFQTTDGKIDLTPTNPTSFSLSVAQSAPRLLGVSITSKAPPVSRCCDGIGHGTFGHPDGLHLPPPPRVRTVATTKVTLPVESSFLAWYTSTASQAYGSLFTASVPFTMQGDVKNVTNVVDTIQSVSVTLTNALGTSAAQSVSLK